MSDLRITFPKPCSENWDQMAPDGSNRFCSRCTKTIHDLANFTPDEAAELLLSEERVCVKASLGSDGVVNTRHSESYGFRRIVVVAAASVGMLAMSSAAIAGKSGPEGVIAGTIPDGDLETKVVAIGTDGTRHEVTTDSEGKFTIEHLPPGTYQLEISRGPLFQHVPVVVVEDEQITLFDGSDTIPEPVPGPGPAGGPGPPIFIGEVAVPKSTSEPGAIFTPAAGSLTPDPEKGD